MITYEAALPLFVRSKTRGEVKVGTVRPNHSILAAGRNPVEVELGGDVNPYVRPADLAACRD